MKNKLLTMLKRQEDGFGFGLYGHAVRTLEGLIQIDGVTNPYALLKEIDETVIQVAQARNWNDEQIFQFMNSRDGRHCGDRIADAIHLKEPLGPVLEYFMTHSEKWNAPEGPKS